nr:hypothetical protein [Scardovia inopinata]
MSCVDRFSRCRSRPSSRRGGRFSIAARHSWNADDLASQAGIDPRFADALLQRGEAPIEAVFSAADALGIDIAALPFSSLGNTR